MLSAHLNLAVEQTCALRNVLSFDLVALSLSLLLSLYLYFL